MNIRQLAGFATISIGLATAEGCARTPGPMPAPATPPAPVAARAPVVTPTTQNANDYYVAASESLDSSIHGADRDYDDTSPAEGLAPYHTALERNQAVLKANARALHLLRLGFQYPYNRPPANVFAKIGYNQNSRKLGRLLILQAHVDAATGNWSHAATCGIDAIQLGVDPSRGGVVMDMLAGNAIEAIGHSLLSNAAPHLNATDAASAARRLATIEDGRTLYANLLTQDMNSMINDLRPSATESQSDWQKAMKGSKSFADFETQYRMFMAVVIANARLPYSTPKPTVAPPTDPIAREEYSMTFNPMQQNHLAPGGNDGFRFLFERARAENRLLELQLALQSYHAKTGHYPDSLTQLVPSILPSLPADPFAVSGKLGYKKTGQTYLLYSIGPDGTDNGGIPIEDKTAKSDREHFRVKADSHGDIVAGVNTR